MIIIGGVVGVGGYIVGERPVLGVVGGEGCVVGTEGNNKLVAHTIAEVHVKTVTVASVILHDAVDVGVIGGEIVVEA